MYWRSTTSFSALKAVRMIIIISSYFTDIVTMSFAVIRGALLLMANGKNTGKPVSLNSLES
jgi:hypothetical protein